MRKPACHCRSSSLSLRSVVRFASLFSRPLVVLSLVVMTLGFLGPAAIAQNIFNCGGWTTSNGPCSISFSGSNPLNFFVPTPNGRLSGTAVNMVPGGSTHLGYSMLYETPVNDQAFTTTFTFVPNGFNFAFVVENANNNGQPGGFAAGAGGEGGFSQFAGGSNIAPNYVFALEFDSGGMNCQTCGYTNGGVQWYQTLQNPALPGDANAGYLPIYPTNKVSVSSPFSFTTGTQYVPTGHTYGATVTYDGSDLTLNMWDVTAGGSCPGASCFTTSWSGVYIPAIVGATTAHVGFTSGVGLTTTDPLYVNSFSYTVNTPTEPGSASFTPWNAGSTYNNGTVSASSPIFSVAPGSYTGTQSVSMTTSSGAYICYLTSTSIPALLPMTDNNGGCSAGTLYSGAVSIASSTTLYAIAGSSNAAYPRGTLSPTGLGPPSTVVSGTYTIGETPQASTPTFSPAAGTYSGPQSVVLSTATSGAVICYNTTGSPATNGSTGCSTGTLYAGPVTVSSNETLYAVAGGAAYESSSVGSASYIIQASVATPTFSPAAGTYNSSQSVTLSDATPDATIYYTTDGSIPTTSSTVYTGPMTVGSTETLKAIAAVTGDSNSAVASAAYTITPLPFFTLAASPTSLTGTSSDQGVVTVTVTPENGFDSTVTFACSGLPAGATCSFSPTTVTPSGSPATTQLTISAAQSSALQSGSRPFLPLTALAMMVCLLGRRSRSRWHHWLLLVLICTGLGVLSGCSGTSGTLPTPTSPTSPTTPTPTSTTSTVTVTAVSGTLQGTATIKLTIN